MNGLVENDVPVPRLMSHQVGLGATVVLVSMPIGGALLGIPGAILAVPTAAIVHVIVQELVTDR